MEVVEIDENEAAIPKEFITLDDTQYFNDQDSDNIIDNLDSNIDISQQINTGKIQIPTQKIRIIMTI